METESQADEQLPKNIILVGFMGCGKSTIGRVISQQLNYPLLDTDVMISKNTKMQIPEIFKQNGEDHFRGLETDLIQHLSDIEVAKHVISTGGGLPIREENRGLLKSLGYVVWLRASVDCILERTGTSNHRPLLNTPDPRQTIASLLTERDPLYEACSDLIIQTDDLAIADTAHGIIESARYYFSKS